MRRALACLLLVLLVVVTVGLVAGPRDAGASGQDVIRDCERHGSVTGAYTQKELQAALRGLPTDDREYTNCEESIAQAQAAGTTKRKRTTTSGGGATGGTGGGASAGGGTPGTRSDPTARTPGSGPVAHVTPRTPNASDTAALSAAQRGQSTGDAGGAGVRPGGKSVAAAGGFGSLPVPVLVVLILLLAGALAALLVAARRTAWVDRVFTRHRA